jgi:hypothetical protein
MRAPQKRDVGKAGQSHVPNEESLAAQQARVLTPEHGPTDVAITCVMAAVRVGSSVSRSHRSGSIVSARMPA